MLPNESLSALAAKFYPNNTLMQREFILKTKRLNNTNLNPNIPYSTLTAITIPNLKTLSASTSAIKRSHKSSSKKALHLSYNIKSTAEKAKEAIRNIPDHLIKQYENLVARNTFLKEEIAKLNKKLVFLQNKLGELKLIFDKTLTPPTKKMFKNLDAEKEVVQKQKTVKVQIKHKDKAVLTTSKTKQQSQTGFFDLSNRLLWLALLGLGLLMTTGSYFLKKYKNNNYIKYVDTISHQSRVTSTSVAEPELVINEDVLPSSLVNDTAIEEHDDQSIMHEAKTLMNKNLPTEAIAHLKWAIRAKSKTPIHFWLYLLKIFRQQDLKEEFERFASELHQTFNVMTPLWEAQTVAMVVPQSLEEHPHIVELIMQQWPDEKILSYLHKLISDNRGGQRSGFSLTVIEEILLLIDVLEMREKE
ncbi:MAG: hypothetical protein ACKE5M_02455 [Methylophilaceae bacterium]